jgi:hypothetical protein
MVRVLASSVVDRWFEPRSGQTKEYKIAIGVLLLPMYPPSSTCGGYDELGLYDNGETDMII